MRGVIADGSRLAGNGGWEWTGSSQSVKLDKVWGLVNSEDDEFKKSGHAMSEVWQKVAKWGDVLMKCGEDSE